MQGEHVSANYKPLSFERLSDRVNVRGHPLSGATLVAAGLTSETGALSASDPAASAAIGSKR
jgi:hypothetical protein